MNQKSFQNFLTTDSGCFALKAYHFKKWVLNFSFYAQNFIQLDGDEDLDDDWVDKDIYETTPIPI